MGIKIIYNLYFTVIGGGGGRKAAIFCIRLEKE